MLQSLTRSLDVTWARSLDSEVAASVFISHAQVLLPPSLDVDMLQLGGLDKSASVAPIPYQHVSPCCLHSNNEKCETN